MIYLAISLSLDTRRIQRLMGDPRAPVTCLSISRLIKFASALGRAVGRPPHNGLLDTSTIISTRLPCKRWHRGVTLWKVLLFQEKSFILRNKAYMSIFELKYLFEKDILYSLKLLIIQLFFLLYLYLLSQGRKGWKLKSFGP